MAPTISPAPATDEARQIRATRVFDAPRELVFDLWTDPQHIVNWWGPNGFTTTIQHMEVRPGGTWEFVMHGPDGRDYKNHITYTEVVRPERIAYRHGPGPIFDAVITFEDENGKTRLTMVSTFESAKVLKDIAGYAVPGMQQTLGRLAVEVAKANVAKSGAQPFHIERVFDAPRALMYEVWTKPEHLRHWWGPKGMTPVSVANDLRVGGTHHYGLGMPDGSTLWGKWVYREIVEGERLVFTSSFSDPDQAVTRHPMAPEWPLETLSIIRFEDARDGKTRVSIDWYPINATEAEAKAFNAGRESMQGGWGGTFDQLAGYLKGL